LIELEDGVRERTWMQRLYDSRTFLPLVVFLTITVVLSEVFILSEAFEAFYDFSRSHEDWELDEYVLAMVAGLLGGLAGLITLVFRDNRRVTEANSRLRDLIIAREEQRRFEVETRKMLAERDRLSAIGVMAGGFAHNFNNLLVPMLGLSRSVRSDLPEGSDLQQDMDIVIEAATQAQTLVDTVLSQARSPEGAGVVPLREAIQNVVALARASMPSKLKIEVEHIGDVPDVPVSDGAVGAALLNLVNNSRDAYGENGGLILIGAERQRLRAPRLVSGDLLTEGAYLVLSVTDRAGGMSEKVRSSALTPFFTTKSAGVGSGLGLFTVVSFAQKHLGGVMIETEAGTGTRVDIMLRLKADNSGLEIDTSDDLLAGSRTDADRTPD
jgi:signal transduction histidine kinase